MTKIATSDSPKKVLVVDDDETLLMLAEEVLTNEGHKVWTFADPQSAWDAVPQIMPDIIVLDVVMPNLTGFEFCGRLRSDTITQDIPVLMMTSLDDLESINRAYEAGATDFAVKPINWTIETNRLNYMLRAADVAQQVKRTEQETRLAKEEWEKTFNAIGDVVTVLDPELKILRANSATVSAVRKPLVSVLGSHCYDLFCGTNGPCPGCPVVQTIQSGCPTSAEQSYCKLEGDRLVTASPVKDKKGRLTHVVHIARDLSDQRQLEAEYRQAQKMEAIGTLAGGIAHDFSNLLYVILGHAELLTLEANAAEKPSLGVQAILDAAKRGTGLAKQLLTFSRRGAEKSEKRPINLNQVVNDFQSMLQRLLPQNVSFRNRLADELGITHADTGQVEQILMNLTVNAGQAMPEGGVLTIETQNARLDPEYCRLHPDAEPGEYVLLAVSDTGHGIDPQHLHRIFEPFFTSKSFGRGTGLGLSIVYGIVKDHNGHICCYSDPSLGTTFRVYLPLLAQPLPSHQTTVEDNPAALVGSETILVVDDEALIRSMVQQYLGMAGYTVIEASDGESAVRKFSREEDRPNLTILDLGMPGMTGWECLEQLRGLDPNAKVLLATGYGGDDVRDRAEKCGVAGLAVKPYQLRELSRRVRQILDAADQPG